MANRPCTWRNSKVKLGKAKQRLNHWFEKFEISHWWDKKIEELSKGMAQKIQFIVTVLHQPKLLIFDEPFSGFDPINANLIKDEILQLRDEGAMVIFSTHRMESVEELCDHIALIHQSKKILDGNLIDIKRKHKTNTFEVGLSSNNLRDLERQISARFDISPADFRSLENDLKLNIKLKASETPNDLLTFLNANAYVNHFVELIPNANDIFIQSCKKQLIMNHLPLIIKREYLAKVKNKSFILMTFLSPLILVGLLSLVAYLTSVNNEKVRTIGVLDEAGFLSETLVSTDQMIYENFNDISLEEAKKLSNENNSYGLLHIPNLAIDEVSSQIKFYSEESPSLSLISNLESKN